METATTTTTICPLCDGTHVDPAGGLCSYCEGLSPRVQPSADTLTVDELCRWLALQTWSDWAQDVARYYRRNGRLSDRQEDAARSMYAKCQARDAARIAIRAAEEQRAAELAEAAAFVAAMPRDLNPGFYVGPGDIIWHVTRGKAGLLYASRHDDERGDWVYVSGAIHALRADHANGLLRPLDADHAGRIGRRTGRCIVCSRELTDPASIEAGIGPVCASRL